MPAAPGARIGGYRLLHRLGQGGMGVVWLAEDEALGRRVALKLLPPHMTFDPEAVWRFRQEASATARLTHPNIVAVFSAGEEEGQRYLAMEYVEGVPLDRLLARLVGRRPAETTLAEIAGVLASECPAMAEVTAALRAEGGSYVRTVVGWIAQAADALAHAHGKGILHRDVKPSNLLLDLSGQMRAVDFGLAQVEEAAPVTRTGALVGTLTYMAPEALEGQRGRADARADIYSLGAVLYEMLAFRPPFLSDSLHALVREVHSGEPAALRTLHPGLPRDLVWIVSKCLAKEPHHRYAAASDLAQDLRRYLEGTPVRARPAGIYRRLRYWGRRHPILAFATGLAIAVAAAAWPVAAAMDRARGVRDAAAEREIADRKIREHDAVRGALARGRQDYAERERVGVFASNPIGAWARAAAEQQLLELELNVARTIEEARAALDRAARIEAAHGGMTGATSEAFAALFLLRYRLAEEEQDFVGMEVWREAVLRHDRSGRWAPEFEGRAEIRIDVTPADAEIFLFRYEPYESRRKDIPRLVPVPTPGIGRRPDADWTEEFGAGSLCLAVRDVEPGSVAAEAGLERGDLVLCIQGEHAGYGVFVSRVLPGSEAEHAAVRPWGKIREVDGADIHDLRQWQACVPATGRERWVSVGAHGFLLTGDEPLPSLVGIEATGCEQILNVPAPPERGRVLALCRGEVREIQVPGGRGLGVTCEATAYPLLLAPGNRVPAGAPLAVTPGSYLLYVRRAGYEDQRYPVYAARGTTAEARVTLQAEGSTPPGFVWIPPGQAVLEGDPDRLRLDPSRVRAARRIVDVPGFFIRRTEVTLGEWFEFVNDPESLLRIEAARLEGRTIYLPRHYNPPYLWATRLPDGRFEPKDASDVPVYGVSGQDVTDFLVWRNRRAEARKEAWLWALPSHTQWARAARGSDGRLFPWGNRFDGLLVGKGLQWNKDRPGRSVPYDESPFGVADLGGSRREWVEDGAALRGGSWGDNDPTFFRASFEDWVGRGYVNWTCGFRPVLLPLTPPTPARRPR